MRFASRKLVITLIGLALAGALSYLDKLSPGAATLIGVLVSGYMTANVTQKGVTSGPSA